MPPLARNPYLEPLRSLLKGVEESNALISRGDDQVKRGTERLCGVIDEAKKLSQMFDDAGKNGK